MEHWCSLTCSTNKEERKTDRHHGGLIAFCMKVYGKFPLKTFISNGINESFKFQESQYESILRDHW